MNSASSYLARCHSRYYSNYCNSSLLQIITFYLVSLGLSKQISKFVIIIIYLTNCHDIIVHCHYNSSLPNYSSSQSYNTSLDIIVTTVNSSFFQIPIFSFFCYTLLSSYLANIIVITNIIIIHYHCNDDNSSLLRIIIVSLYFLNKTFLKLCLIIVDTRMCSLGGPRVAG